jgi:uncharacterized protein YprB with RNaseH-like and TPR domain
MANLKLFLDDLSDQKDLIKKDYQPIDKFISGSYYSENSQRVFIHEEAFVAKQEANLSDLPPCIPNWLHKYSKIFNYAQAEEIVFLDTETTGLDRGANTYAFLTGILYYRDNKWQLKQYFIESPDNEPLLMKLLSQLLSNFKILVSYNGKCYDIPLLDNRFKFHKSDYSIRNLDFLDLLHLSRRLWKPILQGCKLQNIEAVIFNYIRDYSNDIPGEFIPKAYFDYLATNNAEDISNVFYHNGQDLFTLTRILAICNDLHFLDLAFLDNFKIDYFHLAKLLNDIGMTKQALALLEKLAARQTASDQAILLLSTLLKREKKYQLAIKYLKGKEANSPSICLEISMLYEHKIKDLSQAFYYARKAYIMLHEASSFDSNAISEAETRINRIKHKLKLNQKSGLDL